MLPEPDIDLTRRARRQRLLLLVVVNALVLAIALVAAVDLRRLATPGGTALRWVQAAVFGDCADYLEFSVATADVSDSRSPDELCQDLRQATAQARADQLRIGLHLGAVSHDDRTATASVTLTRDGAPTALKVRLVRDEGRWRVLRDAATCASVGCA
ncbi:MAG TPA: hypothetical protein VM097_07820 [Mycobacteriales bacterium]|nr:hypothetical protein [Mycobacteriales bacterium]